VKIRLALYSQSWGNIPWWKRLFLLVLIVPVLAAVLAVLLSLTILGLIVLPLQLISLGYDKIRSLVFGPPTPSFPQLEPPEMDSN
jgi:hypothetical protein